MSHLCHNMAASPIDGTFCAGQPQEELDDITIPRMNTTTNFSSVRSLDALNHGD